jgi:MHS family proline/betaine transporter-like MFS transporter
MTLSTVLIAFVPGYQSIGILASMLVVCLRLLQGISLGGEAGNAPFLIEQTNKANSVALSPRANYTD